MNRDQIRAEILHCIKVGLTMARIRKKRLYRDALDKNRIKADAALDELANEVVKAVPNYELAKVELPKPHSAGGGSISQKPE